MLKDEEKLEQDKTDEVKASSSLVSDTESADKDLVELVENDIKEVFCIIVEFGGAICLNHQIRN